MSAVSRLTTRTPLSTRARRPKLDHGQQQQAHDVGVRVLARLRDVHPAHRMARAPRASACTLSPPRRARAPRRYRFAGDEHLQLVEVRLLAEPRERRRGDVAVDDVLHPRLRLADVVHAAAHAQRRSSPSRRPDRHRVADARASRPGTRRARSGSRRARAARRPAAGVSVLMRMSAKSLTTKSTRLRHSPGRP